MRIENGLAILDDCGTCHQSYIYDLNTHIPTYIDDTIGGVELESSEIFVLAGSPEDIASNPNWNGGPLAAIDSCGDCHTSYMYNMNTHTSTSVITYSDTVGVYGMFVLAGSPMDIASNPNWNAGCDSIR